MVNPKGQSKKDNKEAEEQAVKPLEEVQEQIEELQAGAEESLMKPLDEVLGQAERAYAAYMDAQRQVSKIYKENEQQVR